MAKKQAIKLAKELTTHQCINEKFISLHTSQKVSKRTLLRFSKRDNNKRQSVINPSAIFVWIITAVHLFLMTVEEMEGVGGGGTEVTIPLLLSSTETSEREGDDGRASPRGPLDLSRRGPSHVHSLNFKERVQENCTIFYNKVSKCFNFSMGSRARVRSSKGTRGHGIVS